jgi:molybdopterin synthase catalytic subunit
MKITIDILDGPLPAHLARPSDPGAGAWLCFEGIVRGTESGAAIEALEYQTYEPMAQQMLAEIARDVGTRHGLTSLMVQHSRGRVGVDECSFRLLVQSPHRKPALAAMDEFIDRLKKDVPIWKSAVAGGASHVNHPPIADMVRSGCSKPVDPMP